MRSHSRSVGNFARTASIHCGGGQLLSTGSNIIYSRCFRPTEGGSRTRRGRSREIGRAHVGTPVTNAQLVCRLLLEKTLYSPRNNSAHTNQVYKTQDTPMT